MGCYCKMVVNRTGGGSLHCALAKLHAAQCIGNRPYLFVCLFVCLWVCYHDNSKLRASILTKLGLQVKVVTISSRLNFGRPAPQGRGSAAGRNFWLLYYSQRAVFASPVRLRAFFSFILRSRCKLRVLVIPGNSHIAGSQDTIALGNG